MVEESQSGRALLDILTTHCIHWVCCPEICTLIMLAWLTHSCRRRGWLNGR
ncbi:hypothetical protein BJ165DRAFT_1611650 [Panaeolus papilionaceus]|nr:hypothetical protein BJ165DRAFT_1611650 [Panaeolus papilionaceus]